MVEQRYNKTKHRCVHPRAIQTPKSQIPPVR